MMGGVARVLIVGAGISGLTLAIALRRAQIGVELVEIRSDVRHQPGVGLSLQGNSLAALARTGVAAACLKAGMPANYINVRRPDGFLLRSQPVLATGGAAFPGTAGISRDALHRILLTAAEQAGALLRMGLTFDKVEGDETGVDVQFTDGSRGHFDLMVGADGIYSRTRDLLLPEITPTACGQSVWRAGVPRPEGNFTTEVHFGGPFGVVGICPVSADTSYIYIVETASPDTRYANSELASVMTEKLQPYTGELVRECVRHLPQSGAISYRPLEWLLAPPPWHRDRIVIIGDAAHANPPVLAQGAAMAIEDAVVLAELLATLEPVSAALTHFAARRYARASLVVKNSVQLCEWEVNHSVGPLEVGRLMLETQKALCEPF
jgi:2-polyprenyl-6-methoxyphenol hydroxylase-like FAD-dependent oxidoreductase